MDEVLSSSISLIHSFFPKYLILDTSYYRYKCTLLVSLVCDNAIIDLRKG